LASLSSSLGSQDGSWRLFCSVWERSRRDDPVSLAQSSPHLLIYSTAISDYQNALTFGDLFLLILTEKASTGLSLKVVF
jgi:hypothetical protein